MEDGECVMTGAWYVELGGVRGTPYVSLHRPYFSGTVSMHVHVGGDPDAESVYSSSGGNGGDNDEDDDDNDEGGRVPSLPLSSSDVQPEPEPLSNDIPDQRPPPPAPNYPPPGFRVDTPTSMPGLIVDSDIWDGSTFVPEATSCCL